MTERTGLRNWVLCTSDRTLRYLRNFAGIWRRNRIYLPPPCELMFFFSQKSHKAVADGAISSSLNPAAAQEEAPASQEALFCKPGHLIDLSFQRMSSVVVEHAGEPDMDDHFRGALQAVTEELLHHRRECARCSRHLISQTLSEASEPHHAPSPVDTYKSGSTKRTYLVFAPDISR